MSLESEINHIIDTKFKEFAQKAERVLKEEAPVGLTGKLKDSIGIRKHGKYQYEVYCSAPYAGIVVNGRGPIYPVEKKALRYQDYDGNNRSVHHGEHGAWIITKSSKDSKKNDFVQRAVNRLK